MKDIDVLVCFDNIQYLETNSTFSFISRKIK